MKVVVEVTFKVGENLSWTKQLLPRARLPEQVPEVPGKVPPANANGVASGWAKRESAAPVEDSAWVNVIINCE